MVLETILSLETVFKGDSFLGIIKVSYYVLNPSNEFFKRRCVVKKKISIKHEQKCLWMPLLTRFLVRAHKLERSRFS